MKSNRKPDLMLLLAVFVFIGVVASTLSNNENSTRPDKSQGQDATVPIRTQNNDSHELIRNHFLRVSANVHQGS